MNMELDFVKEMFDSIAPQYDFLNRFLSMRQDVMWRKEMVRAAALPEKGCMVLDVACGTCDVALEVKRQRGKGGRVIATDFSPGMLVLGKRKVDADAAKSSVSRGAPAPGVSQKNTHELSPTTNNENSDVAMPVNSFQINSQKLTGIHLVAGNALSLPFVGGIFDAIFIAFGIRNIMDRKGALAAFHDILKPKGRVVVLELTTPSKGFFRDLYLLYFQQILPAIGGLFSKNQGAYHYLPESVLKFPSPSAFAQLMRDAGFRNVKWKGMTLGIVTLFVGER